jgi:hypothetical protein
LEIPEEVVCFANLKGVNGAYFASLYSIGLYRQVKPGDIMNFPQYGGSYEVVIAWSRERQMELTGRT